MSNVTEIFFIDWQGLIFKTLPFLITLAAAFVTLLLDLWWKRESKEPQLFVAVLGVILSAYFAVKGWMSASGEPLNLLVVDRIALIMFLTVLAAVLAVLFSAFQYLEERGLSTGDFYGLILFAAFGIGLMVSSQSLLVIFFGLEILSLASYVLAGFNKKDPCSQEASIKYFVLGAVASAFFLMGIAFMFGAAGTLDLMKIHFEGEKIAAGASFYYAALSVAFMLVSFGFKMAAVPFQWWTPDVYEGAPLPVTTFFATGIKLAAFVAFWRIAWGVSHLLGVAWVDFIWVIAVITMTVGNIVAIVQSDLKRMLAYSSIAHAGYLLTAFVLVPTRAVGSISAIVFYLIAYVVMTVGAFSMLIVFDKDGHERTDLMCFKGLGFKRPWVALFLSIFLLSLAGFPPTAGFFAKYYLFSAVVSGGFIWLAVLAVLNSVLSVYYYIRPIILMYFQREEGEGLAIEAVPYSLFGVVLAALLLVFYLGIMPSDMINIIHSSVSQVK